MSDPAQTLPRAAAAADPAELLRIVDDLQKEVDGLARQLEHAGRLALLGTLAAGVAHELNNLLTPAVSYATLALKSLDGPSPDAALVRKALEKSKAGGDKAGQIGRAILDLARPAAVAAGPVDCDVNAALDAALIALGRDLSKDGIALVRDVPAGLRVRFEPVALEHVLLNLLSNARGAMLAPGGRRDRLTVCARLDGVDAVRVSVVDTGCGIAPERLARVFEPFESHHAGAVAANHSGLGLDLCRRLVERHGGQIGVESGVGSTFSLVLRPA